MKPDSASARTVRQPAVAGTFYPGDAARLSQTLSQLLEGAAPRLPSAPKALIAPHAGYAYSGPIAASAFVHLTNTTEIRRVVLIGPSHYVGFGGVALTAAEGFATPLGVVPVDLASQRRMEGMPQVRVREEAHAREHSLEVELPFLQTVLEDFQVVPLVTGNAQDEEIGSVIDALWGGPETLLVISSDLSHFYDYETARDLDQGTAKAIEALKPEEIGPEQACGRVAIRGLLWAARRRHLEPSTIDLRNSGDTAGSRDRVVGYGAFGFRETI